MNTAPLTIRDITARAVIAPISRPIRTAVGTIPAAPLVLLDVTTEEGITGRSYLFGYTPTSLIPLVKIVEELARDLKGKAVVPVDRMRELDLRFRLLGTQGLLGMVISGLDMAFWDILGKAAGMPVVRLLGGSPRALRAYDSYGVVDVRADERDILQSLERGFEGIKIKIGDADLKKDIDTVRAVREMIGPDVALMLDYNQSLGPAEACRRIERLLEFDLHWVEEPVSAQDLQGHARVRASSGARIQTGENWWFPRDMQRAISAGACDFAMPDIMKIGGVTGWMAAAALADAASLPVSSHLFIEASSHVLAVTPTFHWLEYLDFAGGIVEERHEVVNGTITAKGPGLGISWDEQAVSRYMVQ
ncbi:enolase C-terminal domain-like protein [Glaciimonas immobilis]|uniref:Mandelate racemase n=1 Tax=Glaciimonas immobilis TaxID=728004 RepID=A0A840RVD2_9BURK|nr:enolase C-terminal domain-like protein [Glaciimonas immobilis]KAF3996053.1 mandelate racemase [Glaciimonas immobilis]MBB5201815.1 mandelate racemase [Glaciimonas immobilis]